MNEQESKELGESFRQSLREFRVMVGIWGGFAVWTVVCNSIFAGKGGEEAEVAILFGMPMWVVIGVVLPWVCAVSATIWFALCFMEDTPLEPEAGES